MAEFPDNPMPFATVQEEWNENGHGTEVPADLATQIRDVLNQDAKLSWEDAIKQIKAESV